MTRPDDEPAGSRAVYAVGGCYETRLVLRQGDSADHWITDQALDASGGRFLRASYLTRPPPSNYLRTAGITSRARHPAPGSGGRSSCRSPRARSVPTVRSASHTAWPAAPPSRSRWCSTGSASSTGQHVHRVAHCRRGPQFTESKVGVRQQLSGALQHFGRLSTPTTRCPHSASTSATRPRRAPCPGRFPAVFAQGLGPDPVPLNGVRIRDIDAQTEGLVIEQPADRGDACRDEFPPAGYTSESRRGLLMDVGGPGVSAGSILTNLGVVLRPVG